MAAVAFVCTTVLSSQLVSNNSTYTPLSMSRPFMFHLFYILQLVSAILYRPQALPQPPQHVESHILGFSSQENHQLPPHAPNIVHKPRYQNFIPKTEKQSIQYHLPGQIYMPNIQHTSAVEAQASLRTGSGPSQPYTIPQSHNSGVTKVSSIKTSKEDRYCRLCDCFLRKTSRKRHHLSIKHRALASSRHIWNEEDGMYPFSTSFEWWVDYI